MGLAKAVLARAAETIREPVQVATRSNLIIIIIAYRPMTSSLGQIQGRRRRLSVGVGVYVAEELPKGADTQVIDNLAGISATCILGSHESRPEFDCSRSSSRKGEQRASALEDRRGMKGSTGWAS